MTREQLHELAAIGAADRIAAIQRELMTYHEVFPKLFTAPPLILAPDAIKAYIAGNGNGTAVTEPHKDRAPAKAKRYSPEHRAKIAASWTPERRAMMARLMKKRSKAMHARRRAGK